MERPPAAARGLLPPRRRVLRYVQACQDNRWHLHLHKFDRQTGEVVGTFRRPYRCCSWRHPGDCRRRKAAQMFSRLSTALSGCRPQDVLYLVLTLDRNSDRWKGKTRFDAFRELRERWKSLFKAIRRHWGGGRVAAVQTVEVHRSGWPHLNVVLVCPQLAEFTRLKGTVLHRYVGRDMKLHRRGFGGSPLRWLKEHAIACGFGHILTMDLAESKQALAGYVTKLAGEVEEAPKPNARGELTGEVVKFTQLPEEAPKHFRRLRATPGFLPPVHKADDVTGELLREPMPYQLPPEKPEEAPTAPAPAPKDSRSKHWLDDEPDESERSNADAPYRGQDGPLLFAG